MYGLTLFQALRMVMNGTTITIMNDDTPIVSALPAHRVTFLDVADYLHFVVCGLYVNTGNALVLYVREPGYSARK